MTEQCLAVNGEKLPPTFNRGSRPVDGVYATAGIDCVSATIFQKYGGVGDHRCFALDFKSVSMIGDVFPRVVPPAGRKLTENERHRQNYRDCLNQLLDRHQMFRKLFGIRRDSDTLSDSQWLLRMNKWDKELEDFMKSAEANCRTYKQCHIEWSPEVGAWMRRRWLLARVKKFLEGKIRDPRNLFRDCRKHSIKDPRFITREELNAEFHLTQQKLDDYAKKAPKLRRQHLKDLHRKAVARGDEDRAKIILRILHREATRKRWRRVNRSTKPPRARSVLSVKVPLEDPTGSPTTSPTNPPETPPPPAPCEADESDESPGDTSEIDESPSSRYPLGVIDEEEGVEEFKTKEGVFFACSKNLAERFRLAFSAPCSHGQLFDDIGFLGDTECARQLLEGTYVFPPGTDDATRLLFEEVAIVYKEINPKTLATYVTVEDFQYYWQQANERISSSYSGLHMGHYKAASFDYGLSALHAAKLSECAKRGLPLARWSYGVTVLLEKIMGNTFVHRLRAICLFEADFNWWNKLVFARRMMQQAHESSIIPDEIFSKKGSHCDGAAMCKTFFCDGSRILHHPAAVEGEDLGDCYDRILHSPCSLSMQAWGAPVSSCRVLFKALQVMKFCLRTGFGESEEFYGGSEEDPIAGLGQGNCMAPPGFGSLGSMIVRAYRRMGHGAKLTSAKTASLFILAAIMFVDDTDLLHWAPTPSTSDDELIEQVQDAGYDWGMLVQASGGILKPPKCSLYLMAYKFVKGRAKLKSLKDLPPAKAEVIGKDGSIAPAHVSIPQPDGSTAWIQTFEVTEASKMLGLHFAPCGNSKTHIEKMRQKGLDWVDCLNTKPLPRRDAWFSFDMQLFPAMSWGLVAVVMSPKKLEEMMQSLYYRVLPCLGINRCITKEWRMLPERYVGLGLPNFVVITLAKKFFFLQCTWEALDAPGKMLKWAYENFVIEVGLYGNPFEWNYESFECLATDGTWFKNVWQLARRLDVEIELEEKYLNQPVRQNDRALIGEFHRIGFEGAALYALKVVANYKQVLHLSDIICCDGITIDRWAMTEEPGMSTHTFPYEQPTRSDFEHWRDAIRALTSGALYLDRNLGPFIREPQVVYDWRTNTDATVLYRQRVQNGEEMHDVFAKDPSSCVTRHGIQYKWLSTRVGELPGDHYATVHHVDEMTVTLHSRAICPTIQDEPTSFVAALQSFPNQSLWRHFVYDGDGEWIRRGMIMGSLAIVHDGSYQEHVSTQVSSAGVYIYCKTTRKVAKCGVAEHSNEASNYRGEILGAIIAQLILRAASRRASAPFQPVTIHCDNRGVLSHGNDPSSSLSEKQSQADLLRYLKQLVRENPFKSCFEWVEGHAVERKGWANCNLEERLNDRADTLAKRVLEAGFVSDEFIDPDLPFEQLRVKVAGKKVTGSLRRAIDNHVGHEAARDFYDRQRIISSENFDLVWWDGLEATMMEFPKLFRVWLTKHVSEFAGTNLQLSHWHEGTTTNLCPSCEQEVESTMHITRCRDPGRRRMFAITVRRLTDWMTETHVDPILVDMVHEYLLSFGEKSMVECLRLEVDEYQRLAEATDLLQWDCFLEGRISPLWISLMKPVLIESGLRLPPEKWGRQFVELLLQITHKQWIFRNNGVHYRGLDGLTQAEHDKIFDRVEELMFTDPDYLLPKHHHLLSQDFEELAEGSAIDQQYWIVSMESAISAKRAVNEGRANPAGLAQLTSSRRRPGRRSTARTSAASSPRTTQAPVRGHTNQHQNQQKNQQQQMNNELLNYPAGSTIPRRRGHPPVT